VRSYKLYTIYMWYTNIVCLPVFDEATPTKAHAQHPQGSWSWLPMLFETTSSTRKAWWSAYIIWLLGQAHLVVQPARLFYIVHIVSLVWKVPMHVHALWATSLKVQRFPNMHFVVFHGNKSGWRISLDKERVQLCQHLLHWVLLYMDIFVLDNSHVLLHIP
jgi:hypothetical protein